MIDFKEPLFDDHFFIQDARPDVNSYHGRKTVMYTVLERTNPGELNELDITTALLRTFRSDQIYLNPTRPDNGREFVDVLVSTPENLLLIQAKDTPNTQQVLDHPMRRKKAATLRHLRKAAKQLCGAISYAQTSVPLQVMTDGVLHDVSVRDRNLIGIIVVEELFSDEFSVYSPVVLDAFAQTGVPCFVMDYPELNDWTWNRRTEASFMDTLDLVLTVALDKGEFPRIRFWPDELAR